MPADRLLVAALILALGLLASGDALASTKCLCDNGMITHSMADGDDVCEDACEMFGGGGRPWSSDDAEHEDEDGEDEDVNVDVDGPAQRVERRQHRGR